MTQPPPRLLFFVTEDWYFCSHRLPLAIAAKKAGFDVAILTRTSKHAEIIRSAGIRLIPSTLERRSLSPFHELRELLRIIKTYRQEQPDIIHQVALKPVLYGSFAALFVRKSRAINALAGLGFVYTSDTIKSRLLRPFITMAFQLLLNRPQSRVILQNPDDSELLVKNHVLNDQHVRLIRGSGVNLEHFSKTPEPKGDICIVLAARMLWDKGIGEFVSAARQLQEQGVAARFILVGKCDPDNPAAISEEQLAAWQREGVIEWWGHQDDMATLFSKTHIVCLPSYREGLPKVLIEAAACGRPIITSDTPGCREVVRPSVNGLLIPLRDAAALAEAMRRLIDNPELRLRMGAQSRQIAEQEFAEEKVIAETLAVYQEVLA